MDGVVAVNASVAVVSASVASVNNSVAGLTLDLASLVGGETGGGADANASVSATLQQLRTDLDEAADGLKIVGTMVSNVRGNLPLYSYFVLGGADDTAAVGRLLNEGSPGGYFYRYNGIRARPEDSFDGESYPLLCYGTGCFSDLTGDTTGDNNTFTFIRATSSAAVLLSAWVYLPSLPPNGVGTENVLFANGGGVGSQGYVAKWRLLHDRGGALQFGWNGGLQLSTAPRLVALQEWHFVAIHFQQESWSSGYASSWSFSGVVSLYVDGMLHDTSDITASSSSPFTGPPTDSMLTVFGSDSGSAQYNGTMVACLALQSVHYNARDDVDAWVRRMYEHRACAVSMMLPVMTP